MTFGASWSADQIIYIAFALQAMGFLYRDELWLRVLIVIGSLCYVTYYSIGVDLPLWEAIVTTSIIALINVVLIGVILTERTTLAMSADETALFARMDTMIPGQFRALVRIGTWYRDLDAPMQLTFEGKPADCVYFVLQGDVVVGKSGATHRLQSGVFIGEVAFLTKGPASAAVRAEPGTTLIAWKGDELERLFARRPQIRNAMLALFNRDMAGKVAASVPGGGAVAH